MLLFAMTGLYGQNVKTSVIGNSGVSNKEGSVKLQWTIGELAISKYEENAVSLQEGFHTSLITDDVANYVNDLVKLENVLLFPNPTFHRTYLPERIDENKIENIVVLNIRGEMVSVIQNPKNSIDLSRLSSGTYIIIIRVEEKVGYLGKVTKI